MSKAQINFNDLFNGLERDSEYLAERAIIEFTEAIAKRMDELELTRSELARRLNTSPAYITKILRGNANFTLKSMVRIAHALDADLKTHLQNDPQNGGNHHSTGALVRIAFDVPEGVLGALHCDREAFIRELRVAAAVKWYESEQVSQGRAAEIAGLSRAEFIDALGRYGVSPFQATGNELASEVESP